MLCKILDYVHITSSMCVSKHTSMFVSIFELAHPGKKLSLCGRRLVLTWLLPGLQVNTTRSAQEREARKKRSSDSTSKAKKLPNRLCHRDDHSINSCKFWVTAALSYGSIYMRPNGLFVLLGYLMLAAAWRHWVLDAIRDPWNRQTQIRHDLILCIAASS